MRGGRVKRVQNKLVRGYRHPEEGYSEYEGRRRPPRESKL